MTPTRSPIVLVLCVMRRGAAFASRRVVLAGRGRGAHISIAVFVAGTIFSFADADRNGKITFREFQRGVAEMGVRPVALPLPSCFAVFGVRQRLRRVLNPRTTR